MRMIDRRAAPTTLKVAALLHLLLAHVARCDVHVSNLLVVVSCLSIRFCATSCARRYTTLRTLRPLPISRNPLQILDTNTSTYPVYPNRAPDYFSYPAYPNGVATYTGGDSVGAALISPPGWQLSIYVTYVSTVLGSAFCFVVRNVSVV